MKDKKNFLRCISFINLIFMDLIGCMQGHVMKSFPSKLLLTTLQSFLSTIQSFVIAIALERNPYEWRLGWDMKLLAISYCVRFKDLCA